MHRPATIEQLGPIIDRLVTYGGARVPDEWKEFLRGVGVAGPAADSWMWPSEHFMADALPAADRTDLLRRVVVRDPLYRMYLDLGMLSVVHSVGAAERWHRLEEILFTDCRHLAPRLLQLLEWQMCNTGRSARDLTSADWERSSTQISGSNHIVFVQWNCQLWGNVRTAADLFSLLLELYVPLCQEPVHFGSSIGECDETQYAIMNSLIAAARQGEGHILPTSELNLIRILQAKGLPVQIIHRETHLVAYLIGAVTCEHDRVQLRVELTELPSSMPGSAKCSKNLLVENFSYSGTWSASNARGEPRTAVLSVPSGTTIWPTEVSEVAPPWLRMPGADVLASVGKRKSDSQHADEALLQLSSHPLYGFLLQLLLLEALDRELGDDTFVLALPQNRRLETVADWAQTRVLYRPRARLQDDGDDRTKGFLVLGSVDTVLDTLAHEVGIRGVAIPYRVEPSGTWSRTLALMNSAGLIDRRPDRWILTITTHIIDRLHSGGLMNNVIRRGRPVREKMHQLLATLWKEQAAAARKEEIPA